MLERFLLLKRVVSEFLLLHTSAPSMVDGDTIAVIEDILPILKLFDQMTNDISNEKGRI